MNCFHSPVPPRCRSVLALTLGACVILTGGSCSRGQPQVTTQETVIPFRKDAELTVSRNGDVYLTLDIEIADNDSARTRGLMQRGPLPEYSGMLFIFPRDELRGFWMANTPIALDIAFANADSEIVHLAKYTRPLSPGQVFSEHPARFVLEVPAGFSDAAGIIETDRLSWRRVVP